MLVCLPGVFMLAACATLCTIDRYAKIDSFCLTALSACKALGLVCPAERLPCSMPRPACMLTRLPCNLQDVKKHNVPELLVMPTDEALFADEGFR